jgi:hypothetical protein
MVLRDPLMLFRILTASLNKPYRNKKINRQENASVSEEIPIKAIYFSETSLQRYNLLLGR